MSCTQLPPPPAGLPWQQRAVKWKGVDRGVILFKPHQFQHECHYNHTRETYTQRTLTSWFTFLQHCPWIPLCLYTPHEMLNCTHSWRCVSDPLKAKKKKKNTLLPLPAQLQLLKINLPQTHQQQGFGQGGGRAGFSQLLIPFPIPGQGHAKLSWALPKRGCRNSIPSVQVLSEAGSVGGGSVQGTHLPCWKNRTERPMTGMPPTFYTHACMHV